MSAIVERMVAISERRSSSRCCSLISSCCSHSWFLQATLLVRRQLDIGWILSRGLPMSCFRRGPPDEVP
eukprot:4964206-Pyramimonas_sp.AAC.1